ncbi:hypothetical protein ACLMJK_008222 [Lecanora helva]
MARAFGGLETLINWRISAVTHESLGNETLSNVTSRLSTASGSTTVSNQRRRLKTALSPWLPTIKEDSQSCLQGYWKKLSLLISPLIDVVEIYFCPLRIHREQGLNPGKPKAAHNAYKSCLNESHFYYLKSFFRALIFVSLSNIPRTSKAFSINFQFRQSFSLDTMQTVQYSPRKPLTLLDLPLELRLQIYELHYNFKTFNELFPPDRSDQLSTLLRGQEDRVEARDIPIFKLPPSIRQKIYKYVFKTERRNKFYRTYSLFFRNRVSRFWDTLLLNTQIYKEAKLVALEAYWGHLAQTFQIVTLKYECTGWSGTNKSLLTRKFDNGIFSTTSRVSSLRALTKPRVEYVNVAVDEHWICDEYRWFWAMNELRTVIFRLVQILQSCHEFLRLEVNIRTDMSPTKDERLFAALKPLRQLREPVVFCTRTPTSADDFARFLQHPNQIRRQIQALYNKEAELESSL